MHSYCPPILERKARRLCWRSACGDQSHVDPARIIVIREIHPASHRSEPLEFEHELITPGGEAVKLILAL